jgi:YbbR domain-containing protein
MMISVIIWFTIKLSDEYDTVIQMPVTFTHLPKNKVLTFVSDTLLQVEILEKGSDLVRMLYVEEIPPVTISLRFLPVYPKGGVYQGIITPSLLIKEIEREQNLLGKIISISPDTIYLSFEPEKSRKVPVKANLDLTFEKEFMKYGSVGYSPDCVTVKGPENSIDALDSVSLGNIKLEFLNQNYSGEKNFPRDSSNQNLSYTPSSVTYSIPVEKFTEAEMEVPVKIISSQGLRVKTFPDKVRIIYMVALKDYPKVEPGMIHAVADISAVNLAEDDRIKVSLESYPSFIRIKKIEPEKVEFIIIK